MKSKITGIKPQKRRPKRRSIFINNKFLCGVDGEIVAILGLKVGQEVDKKRIKEILHKEEVNPVRSPRPSLSDEVSVSAGRGIRPHRGRITSNGVKKAKDYAFKLLSYRPRSIKEIKDRLKKKDYSSRVILEVIKSLKRLKFLNDKEFVRMWMESRIKTRPMGRYRLYQELIQKGIDKDLIEKTLNGYREEEEIELAKELAQRKLKKSYRNLDDLTAKRRLYGFLQRRGFSYDIIQEVLRKLKGVEDDGE